MISEHVWDQDFDRCDTGCKVDPLEAGLPTSCSGNACLLKVNSNGFYSPSGTTNSRFSRVVKIDVTDVHEAEVTSTVSWTGNGDGSLTVVEYIYDWRQI